MRWILCSVLALSFLGCAALNKKTRADKDRKQDGAVALPFGTSVKDSLKKSDGDGDDWKAIEVKEVGKLRVSVLMGNPDCECSMKLIGPDGKELNSVPDFDNNTPRADFTIDKAQPGIYLVHLRAKKSYDHSAYLIEAMFKAAPKPVAVEPEPEEDPVEPVVTPEPPKTVSAQITKTKPGRAGFVVLILDKGSEQGLEEGMTGSIDGLDNSELKIIKVTKTTAEAETPSNASDLKQKKTVTITPKK